MALVQRTHRRHEHESSSFPSTLVGTRLHLAHFTYDPHSYRPAPVRLSMERK